MVANIITSSLDIFAGVLSVQYIKIINYGIIIEKSGH